jgi:hypothetical protein
MFSFKYSLELSPVLRRVYQIRAHAICLAQTESGYDCAHDHTLLQVKLLALLPLPALLLSRVFS